MGNVQNFYGNIDLNKNQILNPSFQLVNSFPKNPAKGQFCFLLFSYSTYEGNKPYYFDGNDWVEYGSSSSSTGGFHYEFVLPDTILNTPKYFYSFTKSSINELPMLSNGDNGLNDEISPIISPISGTITKAILKLKGAGVQNNAVSFPVYYQCNVYVVDYSSNGIKYSIEFPLINSKVGSYYIEDTNIVVEITNLNIKVNKGDAISVQFDPSILKHTDQSTVTYMKNSYISLSLN